MPRTLFGRSLLILVLPVLLIQVIMTIVFFDRHWSKMTSRFAYAVSGEIAVIVETYEQDLKLGESRAQPFQRFLNLDVSYEEDEALPDKQYIPLFAFWEGLVASTMEAELRAQISQPFILEFDFPRKHVSVYVVLEKGILRFDFPQRRIFSSSGYIFLLWVLGASLLLLVISVLFMRNQVRPIRKLAVAAERFGKGQDLPTFKPSGAREVRQAAQAFLDMRRRIQRQISQRTDMLAGISHDLRTPLTRLKLELEILSAKADVADMKADIDEMQRMIDGYLDFVRGDGDEVFEFINISQLFSKLSEALERQGICGDYEIPEELNLRVRALSFERALNNILQNAAKYGERIWVKAFVDDKKLQIQIEDDGPGVPEELYDEVFKPFKRIDESRNTETGGVGLGLSIAMDIIRSHGGNIKLERSSYGGLCVVIRLPL